MYQIGLDTLLKWFKEKDKIILSDEGLYSRAGKRGAEEKLKSFADKNGIKVCFVLYLRRQDEFLESFYRQAMKSNMINTLPISSYVEKRLKNDDYSAKIAFFSDFFGKDSICVRRYDRESWKVQGTNIFADFLSCIGLSLSDEYKLPGKDVNTSLSSNVAEIKRIVNQVNPYLDPEKQLKVNRLFNTAGERCSILSPDKEKYSILSKEDRRGILDAVRESNDNVARDYLDLDHLFSEDIADAPVWNKNNPDFLDDVILYYALVTARLQERLVKQQEDLRKIKRFIPFFWPQLFREWRERRKNTKGKE
ncbi:MAG: hypothetical protein IJT05_03640 [Lachnospiraceae bacterium]|nr:hypothetical protein [Lachnospiraceae bacterium]